MDCRILQHCILLLFCFLFVSDSCFAKKSSLKAIKYTNKADDQENQVRFSSPGSAEQLDADNGDVPVIEPSPPGMSPPTTYPPDVNPTPPTTFPPDMNPTPPTTFPPDMNPTPPMTFPPDTNPTPPTTTGPNVNPPPTDTQPGTNTPPTTTSPGGGAWCIAKPSASETSLQVALDYACGYGGADCSAIQPGATCYEPNTVRDHASYAFNSYYQKNPSPQSCVFGGTAQLTNTDPSKGSCHYASSSSTSSPTPPTTMPMNPPTPPSISSPINPYPPGGQTGFGSEPTDFGSGPTGSPNAAKSISYCLSLLSTLACFVLSLALCSYL